MFKFQSTLSKAQISAHFWTDGDSDNQIKILDMIDSVSHQIYPFRFHYGQNSDGEKFFRLQWMGDVGNFEYFSIIFCILTCRVLETYVITMEKLSYRLKIRHVKNHQCDFGHVLISI